MHGFSGRIGGWRCDVADFDADEIKPCAVAAGVIKGDGLGEAPGGCLIGKHMRGGHKAPGVLGQYLQRGLVAAKGLRDDGGIVSRDRIALVDIGGDAYKSVDRQGLQVEHVLVDGLGIRGADAVERVEFFLRRNGVQTRSGEIEAVKTVDIRQALTAAVVGLDGCNIDADRLVLRPNNAPACGGAIDGDPESTGGCAAAAVGSDVAYGANTGIEL